MTGITNRNEKWWISPLASNDAFLSFFRSFFFFQFNLRPLDSGRNFCMWTLVSKYHLVFFWTLEFRKSGNVSCPWQLKGLSVFLLAHYGWNLVRCCWNDSSSNDTIILGFHEFQMHFFLKKNSTNKNNSMFVLSNANSAQRDKEA